jgi:rubredoxin
VNNLEKWECIVCGYIYDPEIGDSEHGIPPGTSFEALPENWVCPVCGALKDQFVKKE